MGHSHLLIKHLLKQLEVYADERQQRDLRPQWLTDLIHDVAGLFEPFAGVGRVGFECEFVDDCWEARMYLGSTEIVGGKEDGRSRHVSFAFDIRRLCEQIEQIDQFDFSTSASSGCSFLTLAGRNGPNSVRLKIYSRPPQDAGPALREHQDGRIEAV